MKIAVLADTHVGLPETQFPGQIYEFAPDVLRRAVQAILDEAVDETIVVGDLVNMGTSAECRLANEILAPLAGRVRVVPGNHDVIDQSAADFSMRIAGATLNQIVDHGVVVAAMLNSAIENLSIDQWHGRLAPAALTTLDAALQRAGGRPVIIFVHHPPAGTVRTLDLPMMTLTNGDALLTRLDAYAGQSIVFCGHNHCGDLWRRRRTAILGCPPTSFWPHAFLILDIHDGILSIRERRLFDRADESPHKESRQNEDYRRWAESTVPELKIRLA
jgi:3',5'-cyclic-AMP phosphodiesterase